MVDKYNQELAYENKMVSQQGAYYPTTEQRQMNVWQRYNCGTYWTWSTDEHEWATNANLFNQCSGQTPGVNAYADTVKNWANQNPQWCK